MAKKVLSFILATMLMMSVLCVSAAEANPATIYADGFETGSIAENGTYANDVWNLTDAASEASAGKYSGATVNAGLAIVEQGTASDTNRVLEVSRINSGGFHMSMSTANVEIPSDKAVYAGFKFMFTGYPGSAKQWFIGVGRTTLLRIAPGHENYSVADNTAGSWASINENAETRQLVKYNTWLTVMMKITGTTAQAWVYDANGVLLTTAQKTGTFKGYPSIFHPNESGATNVKMYIDDSFYGLVGADNTIALQSSNLADNAVNVAIANQSVNLKFDMPVGDLEEGDVTCGGATISAKKVAYDTVSVDLSSLAYETAYTLDFSGVTGMSGNALTGKSAISFTTMAKPANPVTIDYTDDFTGKTATNNTYTSDVWNITASGANTIWGGMATPSGVTVVKDGTNDVLKVQHDNEYAIAMNTGKKGAVAADETIYASFRFKVPNEMTGNGYWLIGDGSNLLISLQTWGTSNTGRTVNIGKASTWNGSPSDVGRYNFDEWYSVLIKISANESSAYVYNEAGNLILSNTKAVAAKGTPSIMDIMGRSDRTNPYILIDDSRYMVVTNGNTMALKSSTLTEGATNVALYPTTFDLKFDMPVAEPAAGAITCGDATVTANKVDYDTIRVSLSPLAPETAYTLNFAGVTGLSGNALYGTKTLSFTSAAATEDLMVIDLASILMNDNTVAPSQRITVANVGDAKEDVDFIVAFYTTAGKLVGAQWVTDVDFGAQATATLQLADDGYVYRDVYGIRVFAFTSDSELKPVFSGASYGNLWD